MTCETWHVTCDTLRVTLDLWHVTCDAWHVTPDMWHVTCDTWHVTLRGPHGPSQGVWRGGPMRGLGSGHMTCGEDLSNGRRCLLHRGQTYTNTDTLTSRLYGWIGPVGRFSENQDIDLQLWVDALPIGSFLGLSNLWLNPVYIIEPRIYALPSNPKKCQFILHGRREKQKYKTDGLQIFRLS